MNRKYKRNPPIMGIFFIFILVVTAPAFSIIGCARKVEPAPSPSKEERGKDDEFILMVSSELAMERSVELMKQSTDYKTGETDLLNLMSTKDDTFEVAVDPEDAYACVYPDGRKVVFYPISDIKLPSGDEILPLGFLHYFDDNQMNVFFQVITEFSPLTNDEQETPDVPPRSGYRIFILSKDGERFGLPGSRMLEKSDLSDEEAFRKFDASSRRVLIGTNSADENKFLFIFLKIPGIDDQIFQIFHRWY